MLFLRRSRLRSRCVLICRSAEVDIWKGGVFGLRPFVYPEGVFGVAFRVMNAVGVLIAGDSVVDDVMRAEADRVGGWIEADDGTHVYDAR